MNPFLRISSITAGAVVGYLVIKKVAGRPMHSLAVATTKGALNLAGGVEAAGESVARGWRDIVQQAREDMDRQKEAKLFSNKDSIMNKVSDNVADYMHKTAETIENLADKLEYRDKGMSENKIEVISDIEE